METKEVKNYVFYQLDDPRVEMQTITLLFKTGSIQETENTNGSAHVLEHMMVHYISECWKKQYGEAVLCIGTTEYDYILIRVDFLNKLHDGIQYCFDIFNQIMDGKMLDERLFNISLAEVIKEYLSKKKLVEEQRRIISKITCGDINYHPVGELRALNQLKIYDIVCYFSNCLRNVERAIILKGKNCISDKDTKYLKAFPINKAIDNVSISRHVQLGKYYTDEILRYFLLSYAQINLAFMERILLMDVLEQKYDMYSKGNIGVFDKSISKDYQFIYLYGNVKEASVIDLVKKYVREEGLSQKDIDSSKKRISEYINECKINEQIQNTTSKLKTITRNFMYGDDILFIDNYELMLSEIDNVQIDQINYKVQNNI